VSARLLLAELPGDLPRGSVGSSMTPGCVRAALALVAATACFVVSAPAAQAGEYVVFLNGFLGPEATIATANAHARLFDGRLIHVYRALGGYSIELPDGNVHALEADPLVQSIAPNHVYARAFPAFLEMPPPRQGPEAPPLMPAIGQSQLFRPFVPCPPPENTSLPTISGSIILGSTVTGFAGDWDLDGKGCITDYRIRWQRFLSGGAYAGVVRTVHLTPPNKYDYMTLQPSDTGYKYRLEVTAYDSAGFGTAYSTFTPIVYCGGSSQSEPTGVDRIEADYSSQVSGNCQGQVSARVGVLDTGVNLHPDLNITSADQRSCIPGLPGTDDFGHGTAVAGILAAHDNTIGGVGVAPGASIFSMRVGDAAGATTDDWVLCGIDQTSFTLIDGSALNDVGVANMSFFTVDPLGRYSRDDGNCGNTNGDPLHQAVCRATARGLVLVAAAGNSTQDFGATYWDPVFGYEHDTRPASFNEVLTVTAMADYNGFGGGGVGPTCNTDPFSSPDDRYAGYSNYATQIPDRDHSIAAPGNCLLSTTREGGYRSDFTGTSGAAPTVTGVIALCRAAGQCSGGPSSIIATIRSDAQSYSSSNPGFRYTGDPFSPVSGYYGYLVQADLY
jgi:subtilisin